MKNKLKLGLLALISLLVMVGCQKPTDPKEAAEVLVRGLIYQENPNDVEKMFVMSGIGQTSQTENDFIAGIESMLTLNDQDKAELTKVFQEMEKNFQAQTDFKVKIISNQKGKAELAINIAGLAAPDEAELEKELEQALADILKNVTEETTETEINDLVNQVSFDVLLKSFQAERKTKEVEKVTLSLMADAKEKDKWVIQNQDTFINDLLAAFGQ